MKTTGWPWVSKAQSDLSHRADKQIKWRQEEQPMPSWAPWREERVTKDISWHKTGLTWHNVVISFYIALPVHSVHCHYFSWLNQSPSPQKCYHSMVSSKALLNNNLRSFHHVHNHDWRLDLFDYSWYSNSIRARSQSVDSKLSSCCWGAGRILTSECQNSSLQ